MAARVESRYDTPLNKATMEQSLLQVFRIHPSYDSVMSELFDLFEELLTNDGVSIEMNERLTKNSFFFISYGNYGGYIYFSKSHDLPTDVGIATGCWQYHRLLALPPVVGNRYMTHCYHMTQSKLLDISTVSRPGSSFPSRGLSA
jgi:hypothetical protein